MFVNIKGHSLLKELPRIYRNEGFCDLIFICKDGKKVKAHKLLLGSVSSFLRNLFNEHLVPGMIDIFLPDFSSEEVGNVMRYIYEGTARVQKSEISQFRLLCQLLDLNVSIVVNIIGGNQEETEEWNFKSDHVLTEKSVSKVAIKRKAPNLSSHLSTSPKISRTARENINATSVINKLNETVAEAPSQIEETTRQVKQLPEPIPLKYFKDFVCKVERNKAEKNMMKLVKELVKKEIAKEKETLKNMTQMVREEKLKEKFETKQENTNHSVVAKSVSTQTGISMKVFVPSEKILTKNRNSNHSFKSKSMFNLNRTLAKVSLPSEKHVNKEGKNNFSDVVKSVSLSLTKTAPLDKIVTKQGNFNHSVVEKSVSTPIVTTAKVAPLHVVRILNSHATILNHPGSQATAVRVLDTVLKKSTQALKSQNCVEVLHSKKVENDFAGKNVHYVTNAPKVVDEGPMSGNTISPDLKIQASKGKQHSEVSAVLKASGVKARLQDISFHAGKSFCPAPNIPLGTNVRPLQTYKARQSPQKKSPKKVQSTVKSPPKMYVYNVMPASLKSSPQVYKPIAPKPILPLPISPNISQQSIRPAISEQFSTSKPGTN